jgi:hypothetical protein
VTRPFTDVVVIKHEELQSRKLPAKQSGRIAGAHGRDAILRDFVPAVSWTIGESKRAMGVIPFIR